MAKILVRKKLFDRVSTFSNWGLIIAGIFLLIYQLNGFFTIDDGHHIRPQTIDSEEHHHH